MNKQELLENYTMEQLADMVIEREKQLDQVKEFRIFENIKKSGLFNNPIEAYYQAKMDINDKRIDVLESTIIKNQDEINSLKDQLQRKETIINQIDDILNELFGVTHDVVEKPEKFKEILKEKIENRKTIADFLPTEPIKIADMLISAEGEYERNAIGKAFYGNDKGTYNLFDISELRQIAEHLLIYCNANKEGEE